MNTERCSAHTHLQEPAAQNPVRDLIFIDNRTQNPTSPSGAASISSRRDGDVIPAGFGSPGSPGSINMLPLWGTSVRSVLCLLLALLAAFAVLPAKAQVSLVATGSVWKYNDT